MYLPAVAQPAESKTIAFDTLSGHLPAVVKSQSKPYIVITNIEVPFDKTVTIEPGVVMLFGNFSGLHVRGKLIASGTEDKPIVFTSVFNKTYNPNSSRDANPFDWDGIYFTSDAFGSTVSNCQISYSVYCITSDTKFLRLNPVSFKDNGKSVISIENQDIAFSDTLFSYVLDKKELQPEINPPELVKEFHLNKGLLMRISSLAIVAGGIFATAYNANKWHSAQIDYRNACKSDSINLHRNNGEEFVNEKHAVRNRYIVYTYGGSLLIAVGAIGVKWSFSFKEL
jgi:hypothetical protein